MGEGARACAERRSSPPRTPSCSTTTCSICSCRRARPHWPSVPCGAPRTPQRRCAPGWRSANSNVTRAGGGSVIACGCTCQRPPCTCQRPPFRRHCLSLDTVVLVGVSAPASILR
jgi:hypothetical protein